MIEYINKNKILIICALVVITVFLTFYQFTSTPKVWVDEGVFTEISKNIYKEGKFALQTSPNNFYEIKGWVLSTSYPVLYPVSLSMKIFGQGLIQARIPMLFYIILLIFISFFLVQELYGFYPAIISSLLLLSFSPIYGNGRPVQGEVPGIFFLLLGSYFLLLVEKSEFADKKYAFMVGVALGLSCATKALFLTFIPISLLVSAFIIKKKYTNETIKYFFIGFLPPILYWVFIHFSTWNSLSSIFSSYLFFASNHDREISSIQNIIINLRRFISEPTPILFAIILMIITISYFYIFKKEKKLNIYHAEFFIYVFIILNFIGYLNGTGWYRYFFPSHVLVYILFSGAVVYLSKSFNIKYKNLFLIGLPLLLISFQFYHLVYLSDTSFVHYRNRNNLIKEKLSSITGEKSVLFYNSIEAVVFLKSSNYYQYLQMGDFLIAGDKDSLSNTKVDYILVDKSQVDNIHLSCYKEEQLSQYYFLTRTSKCK